MKVEQIYALLNTVTSEILGETVVVAEDLSNVVDIGTEIFNATDVDNYVKKLINHIGKVIFVNRTYNGTAPSVLMDSWEFGSVLEKISGDLPDASENSEWGLKNGNTYNQDVFYQPSVDVKFFNSKVTFEIPISFTERQVKESFSNAEQLNAFLSMIMSNVEKSLTVKLDALIMRTINNMTAHTLHAEFPEVSDGNYSMSTGVKAVNLLKLFNDKFKPSVALTSENCLQNADFVKFASMTMGLYVDRLAKMSTLFNVGKKERFTPKELLHFVMLSEFEKTVSVYLQSETFHDTYTALPEHETVPYWQGSGQSYSFNETSEIHVNINDGEKSAEVVANGIIGVMFDRDALGVTNLERRVTTHYNAKGEFFNNFYKADAGYFNDLNENFVVFFVA